MTNSLKNNQFSGITHLSLYSWHPATLRLLILGPSPSPSLPTSESGHLISIGDKLSVTILILEVTIRYLENEILANI